MPGDVRSSRDGLASISSALDDDIGALEQASADYEELTAAIPDAAFVVPSRDEIDAVIKNARASERAARHQIAAAVENGEALLVEAQGLAAAAQRECDRRGSY